MTKGRLLYEGKAKKIFEILENSHQVLVEFKNSLTAFNAQKKGEFESKGMLNCQITTLLFQALAKNQISSHHRKTISDHEMIVDRVEIIPLEVVVRNVIAGGLARKLGRSEGEKLKSPLVEFYFKDDVLADPFVSDDQILAFEWATAKELEILKTQALKINQVLQKVFLEAGILLVDFKVEFGRRAGGDIILADEISPDCARLWDLKTQEKMDKDRFRRDLGNIAESYQTVYSRLKEVLHG
jgi:phosphoribosylaminoimidazole-succinocarboxamide synthase